MTDTAGAVVIPMVNVANLVGSVAQGWATDMVIALGEALVGIESMVADLIVAEDLAASAEAMAMGFQMEEISETIREAPTHQVAVSQLLKSQKTGVTDRQ